MPNFNTIDFCTVEDVKRMTAIGQLVDYEKLEPGIRPAGVQVQAVLGRGLTSALKSLIFFANPILSITPTNPVVATTLRPHGYVTGDIVAIDHPKGMIDSEGSYSAFVTGANTFELRDAEYPSTAWDGTAWGSYATRSAVTFKISAVRYSVLLMARQLQAMYAYHNAISGLAINKVNAGIMEANSSNFRPVKEEVLAKIKNEAMQQANSYGLEIQRIICENPSEFPEISNAGDRRTNPSGTFFPLRSI